MRTVTKAGHTDCRKHSPHCQKPLHYGYAITFLPRLAVPCVLRLLTAFFLVSPATFVPWTPLLPPSLFPSPAAELVPSTSKGKFLCFPATTLPAVQELLSGAIRPKTWARRQWRRRSVHYSYHSTPFFLPSFLHSYIPFTPFTKPRKLQTLFAGSSIWLISSCSLFPPPSRPVLQYNHTLPYYSTTRRTKTYSPPPPPPPLPFSSLLCLLLPKPQLHISSFHGLYEKRKTKTQSSLPLSLSLSHSLWQKLLTDGLLLLFLFFVFVFFFVFRECAARCCCSCLGTQTVPFFFFFFSFFLFKNKIINF